MNKNLENFKELIESLKNVASYTPIIKELEVFVSVWEKEHQDAERYNWIKRNIKETIVENNIESIDTRLQFKLPCLISYTCVGEPVSLDEAIDMKMKFKIMTIITRGLNSSTSLASAGQITVLEYQHKSDADLALDALRKAKSDTYDMKVIKLY